MLKVTINGQLKTFDAPLNLFDVLEQEELIGMMIAVAKNGDIVPKSEYKNVPITDGDILEILAPMQGG